MCSKPNELCRDRHLSSEDSLWFRQLSLPLHSPECGTGLPVRISLTHSNELCCPQPCVLFDQQLSHRVCDVGDIRRELAQLIDHTKESRSRKTYDGSWDLSLVVDHMPTEYWANEHFSEFNVMPKSYVDVEELVRVARRAPLVSFRGREYHPSCTLYLRVHSMCR